VNIIQLIHLIPLLLRSGPGRAGGRQRWGWLQLQGAVVEKRCLHRVPRCTKYCNIWKTNMEKMEKRKKWNGKNGKHGKKWKKWKAEKNEQKWKKMEKKETNGKHGKHGKKWKPGKYLEKVSSPKDGNSVLSFGVLLSLFCVTLT